MQEWQELQKYIDHYVYVMEKEEICVVHNEKGAEAERIYQYFAREAGDQKWEFDIALDCIRQMDEETREMIVNDPDYRRHHFGVGMNIRNQYIHSSARQEYLDADNESSLIFRVILTILHPYYDFRNKLLVEVMEDSGFKEIKREYGEVFGDIIEGKLERVAREPGGKNRREILEELREELKEKLGPLGGKEFFKEKFIEAVKECRRRGAITRNRFVFRNAVQNISPLYDKEFRQMAFLFETHLFPKVASGEIKSEAECRQYIKQKMELEEENDADFLAECVFAAFHKSGI